MSSVAIRRPAAVRIGRLLFAAALAAAMVASPSAQVTRAAANATEPPSVAPRPSGGCSAKTIATGRRIEQTITVDGVERRYILDVPATLEPGKPAALLFDFHGIGHSGAGVWDVSGFRQLAPRERFITVYPTGLPVSFTRGDRMFSGPGWQINAFTPNRDVDFTLAMLDRIEQTYCIDEARVFSTGFSNGGFFSHVLACTHPERFAAVAPVSGGWLASWTCAPSRPVPVLIHHGRQDNVIDVGEAQRAFDAWLSINGCAAPPGERPVATTSSDASGIACRTGTGCRGAATVVLCEGDFEHRWPASATQRVWDFLRAHPLPPRH